MFISRRKLKALEKRIADLEGQVQGQQKIVEEHIISDARSNDEIIKLIHCGLDICTSFEKQ